TPASGSPATGPGPVGWGVAVVAAGADVGRAATGGEPREAARTARLRARTTSSPAANALPGTISPPRGGRRPKAAAAEPGRRRAVPGSAWTGIATGMVAAFCGSRAVVALPLTMEAVEPVPPTLGKVAPVRRRGAAAGSAP